ncbi:MAG: GIY-YIG nuclease family protein, partial [Methylococcales bacterium]|nr:GIY-YIG nuclease family protein [Methylococcales bacterium]
IGKTIRIYLDNGSVTGIRHAEIVNWTGQAVSSPRTQIKSLSAWDESKKPGVYFLFGVDEASGQDAVYIGEAENVFERLQNHITNKDFWNEVVFFTSKDENLTKSHVKYLESRLVKIAKTSGRYVVLNGNEPQLPVLPRGDRDAMEEFISNLSILLGTVGYKVLEQLAKGISNTAVSEETVDPDSSESITIELLLKVKGVIAKSYLTNEGIVVLTSSQASKTVKESLSGGYKKLREQLIENGVLKEDDSGYVFTKNQLFKSPSQAAAIIVGYAINGRHHWQTQDGLSLKNIEEFDEKNI